jgi:hypothetical protein
MKIHHLIIMSAMLFGASINIAYSDSSNCVNCGPKEVPGMPGAGNKTLGSLEKVAKASSNEEQDDYTISFCMKFKSINPSSIVSFLKEMESSPYPVDKYLTNPKCQPEGYSNNVKSPMFHIIVDDPTGRSKFLKNFSLYYLVKRKEPIKFTEALNAKNTKGETFLDYIETIKKESKSLQPEQIEELNRFTVLACTSGGIYSTYSNLKCATSI